MADEGTEPRPAVPSRADPTAAGFHFERLHLPLLDAHVALGSEDVGLGYGSGGALLDFDGDGDLDLFLGRSPDGGSPPCVYRNDSTPGHLAFGRIEGWCLPEVEALWLGTAIDTDGDDAHELIAGGADRLLWLRATGAGVERVDLLEETLPGSASPCHVGALLAGDIDANGRPDILVGCRLSGLLGSGRFDPTFALDLSDPHLPTSIPASALGDLEAAANVLAFASGDFSGDGLLDIVQVADTFSAPGARNTLYPPGGTAEHCGPEEACAYRLRPFVAGSSAWGSYMAAGWVELAGGGGAIYLADLGPNRLVSWPAGDGADRAPELGADIGEAAGTLLFAWSAIVHDLDRNGQDDVLLSQGNIHAPTPSWDPLHFHAALLQGVDGRFSTHVIDVGFQSQASSSRDLPPLMPRGSALADLDADGAVEWIVASWIGAPELYRLVEHDPSEVPRCTVRPHPDEVLAWGHGYAVSGADGRERRWSVQGQFQFGASPWLVTTASSGLLRFPSGARIPFDCGGTAGPIDVREPRWPSIEWADGTATISVEPRAFETAPRLTAVVVRQGAESAGTSRTWAEVGEGRWQAAVSDTEAFMLQFDGRWVGTWHTAR